MERIPFLILVMCLFTTARKQALSQKQMAAFLFKAPRQYVLKVITAPCGIAFFFFLNGKDALVYFLFLPVAVQFQFYLKII